MRLVHFLFQQQISDCQSCNPPNTDEAFFGSLGDSFDKNGSHLEDVFALIGNCERKKHEIFTKILTINIVNCFLIKLLWILDQIVKCHK